MIQSRSFNCFVIFINLFLSIYGIIIGIYDVRFVINGPYLDHECRTFVLLWFSSIFINELFISPLIFFILILSIFNIKICQINNINKDLFLQVWSPLGHLWVGILSLITYYETGESCYNSQIGDYLILKDIVGVHFFFSWIIIGIIGAIGIVVTFRYLVIRYKVHRLNRQIQECTDSDDPEFNVIV